MPNAVLLSSSCVIVEESVWMILVFACSLQYQGKKKATAMRRIIRTTVRCVSRVAKLSSVTLVLELTTSSALSRSWTRPPRASGAAHTAWVLYFLCMTLPSCSHNYLYAIRHFGKPEWKMVKSGLFLLAWRNRWIETLLLHRRWEWRAGCRQGYIILSRQRQIPELLLIFHYHETAHSVYTRNVMKNKLN